MEKGNRSCGFPARRIKLPGLFSTFFGLRSVRSLGRIRLRRIVISVATTTEEEPNTVVTQSGKPLPARQPGTWVIPTPSATESPTTVLFRR